MRTILLSSVAIAALSTAGTASPLSPQRLSAGLEPHALVKIHDVYDDPRYDDHGYRHRRHHHRHGDAYGVVEAPFTRVEHGRRVVVDAPFAHVYSGYEGSHIRAPFVDLWIPN